MTTAPMEPQDPDGVPGDDPDVPTDPDQQQPEIVAAGEPREDIAAPDPVEDK